MYLPNEIVNIILSFVERPKSSKIINEINYSYNSFIKNKISNPTFKIYFFRLFLPIRKHWPENFPSLLKLRNI